MRITETLNARIQEILTYYGVHDTFGADDTAEIATRIEKELKLEIKKAHQQGCEEAVGRIEDFVDKNTVIDDKLHWKTINTDLRNHEKK